MKNISHENKEEYTQTLKWSPYKDVNDCFSKAELIAHGILFLASISTKTKKELDILRPEKLDINIVNAEDVIWKGQIYGIVAISNNHDLDGTKVEESGK